MILYSQMYDYEVPIQEALTVEHRRLSEGLLNDEPVVGLCHESFLIRCNGNAPDVLARAIATILVANREGRSGNWPEIDEWLRLLPKWFVRQCAPELSAMERARYVQEWHALSYEERLQQDVNRRWCASAWLHWMDPSERRWIWRGGRVKDANTLLVQIDHLHDPPLGPPGELEWLLLASGATEVDDTWERDDRVPMRGSQS